MNGATKTTHHEYNEEKGRLVIKLRLQVQKSKGLCLDKPVF